MNPHRVKTNRTLAVIILVATSSCAALSFAQAPDPGKYSAEQFEVKATRGHKAAMCDGRWKLQLPHTYRTLAGRPGGKDGIPAQYDQRKVEQPELYDLQNDVGEAKNVFADHPDIVKRLEAFAEKMRADLGDKLTKRKGSGVREPGRFTAP
jgi:arylsulfatase